VATEVRIYSRGNNKIGREKKINKKDEKKTKTNGERPNRYSICRDVNNIQFGKKSFNNIVEYVRGPIENEVYVKIE